MLPILGTHLPIREFETPNQKYFSFFLVYHHHDNNIINLEKINALQTDTQMRSFDIIKGKKIMNGVIQLGYKTMCLHNYMLLMIEYVKTINSLWVNE